VLVTSAITTWVLVVLLGKLLGVLLPSPSTASPSV